MGEKVVGTKSILKKSEDKSKKQVGFSEQTEDNEGKNGETKDDSDCDLSFDGEELQAGIEEFKKECSPFKLMLLFLGSAAGESCQQFCAGRNNMHVFPRQESRQFLINNVNLHGEVAFKRAASRDGEFLWQHTMSPLLSKLCYLLDFHSLDFAFKDETWRLLALASFRAIETRFENLKELSEEQASAKEVLAKLGREEQVEILASSFIGN